MAAKQGPAIQLTGFRELRRTLREADQRFPRELGQANKRIVERELVPYARQRAAGLGHPRPGRAVIDSIRGSAASTGAVLLAGGAKVPHFFGHEYGSLGNIRGPSRRGTKGHTRMFRPWRGAGAGAGYFIWPTIRDRRQAFLDAYLRMIDDLMRGPFPD